MLPERENLFKTMAALIEAGEDPVDHEAEIWSRYGETVAALILDSSGFSRVTESHGIVHFLSRLMQLREIAKPIFEAHNARRVKFEADNAYGIFHHPDDAIRTSLALHRAILDEKLMLTADEPFTVCIGIGYGRMLYSETLEGYFAEEMNFASKLGEDTADGGETLLTHSAYDAASEELLVGFEHADTFTGGMDLPFYRHRTAG